MAAEILAHREAILSANAIDLAINVMVAIDQADVLHLGADLDHQRSAFDLQVLDHRDGVAVLQQVAHRVLDGRGLVAAVSGSIGRPLVAAFGTDQLRAIHVAVFGVAFRARRQGAHGVQVLVAESRRRL